MGKKLKLNELQVKSFTTIDENKLFAGQQNDETDGPNCPSGPTFERTKNGFHEPTGCTNGQICKLISRDYNYSVG